MAFYWERYPDGPFARLIAVATNYLHPEGYDLDWLKRFAGQEGVPKVEVFKAELRQALADPSRLPAGELFRNVQYENGSDAAFLRWLWHELYGDEPFDASVMTD